MKKMISIFVATILCCGSLSGCVKTEDTIPNESTSQTSEIATEEATQENKSAAVPEITQIHSICELATTECYYHNVAKSVKEKGDGLSHFGEADRSFWIEYVGCAKIGIEAADVTMQIEENTCTITILKAKILSISVDPESYNKDSYISSQDSWNANPITAEDQTKTIDKAQKNMQETIENDSSLLLSAQDRAKKMIESYINQLTKISGTNYQIKWEYEKNDSSTNGEYSQTE